MAEIKLYDYEVADDWGWCEFFCIGQGNLSASVVVPLIEAVPEDEEILVKINSVGGFVFDGWAIYNALKAHKAKVVVRIDGLAASIASIIAMAGDEVNICQAAMLMIHKPTVDGFWMGSVDAETLKKEANALDQIQAVLNSIYVSKTGMDAAAIDGMINAETWITPDVAKALGFADSILGTISNEVIETTLSENIFKHVFKNANAQTMAYANKTIKVNKENKNMDNVKEALEKHNTLLTEIGIFFKNIVKPKNEGEENNEVVNSSVQLENESYIYFDGALAVGTKVYTDEAMTEAASDGDHTLMDGRTITVADAEVTNIQEVVDEAVSNEALVAENTSLKERITALEESVNSLTTAVTNSNEALEKINKIKSTYKPENREQEFSTTTVPSTKPDFSNEAREARKQEIKDKKNKK